MNLSGTTAPDFALPECSPARNRGIAIAEHTLDYLNRTVPAPDGVADIGAFEYRSTGCAPRPPVATAVGGASPSSGTTGDRVAY